MLKAGSGGSIVNTASVGGTVAIPAHGEYIAAKHAVIGLTRIARSEEHTSELQSLMRISYAVFCLKKKKKKKTKKYTRNRTRKTQQIQNNTEKNSEKTK